MFRSLHLCPQAHYQSAGGVVGALLAAAGTRLPGDEWALAAGNSLGCGPLLFHLPQVSGRCVQAAAGASG